MNRHPSTRRSLVLRASLLALLVTQTACANSAAPATTTKGTATQTISAADKKTGAEAHPQLLAEYGGAETGAIADYVASVGKTISVRSGLSNARDDFTVTLLNSSVNNAFAIPGGYVYVTRQLVGLMNNEAELAGVLGHEVGHVAARHAAKRQSTAAKNQIIGVLGSVLAGAVLGNSQAAQVLQQGLLQGSQLLTLKYSRTQELEADRLGISYLRSAGYDPRAMSTVLQSLANQNALDQRLMGVSSQTPAWASTHPDPASRVRTALSTAGANATGVLNRDVFLSRINGVMYGDDPKQGVIEGRTFSHPEFKLRFDVPTGYYMINGTRAVSIGGQTGKAEFTGAAFNGNLDDYVRSAFAALGQQNQATITPGSVSRTTVNGIPAAYATAQVTSGNQAVNVTVFAYQWSASTAYHFVTLTPANSSSNPFNSMFGSIRRLSDSEAAAIKPRKVSVVTVRSGDTVQSLAARMAYTDAPLDRFLVLNGLASSAKLTAGQKVKIVTY